MECRCTTATEFYGAEAEEYARSHLRPDEEEVEALEGRLSCPDTGTRWVLDYPESTESDPGQARLRTA